MFENNDNNYLERLGNAQINWHEQTNLYITKTFCGEKINRKKKY